MKTKVLVIGRGNMGKRYLAILKYLGVDHDSFDVTDSEDIEPDIDGCTHAIVSTPIDQHYDNCVWCIDNHLHFICEKPVSYTHLTLPTKRIV